MKRDRTDYLLTQLASECAEIVHRVTKAQHFGLHEKQPGQDKDNIERIAEEVNDLFGVLAMLTLDEGILPPPDPEAVLAKKARVEHYMKYARQCGTLEG